MTLVYGITGPTLLSRQPSIRRFQCAFVAAETWVQVVRGLSGFRGTAGWTGPSWPALLGIKLACGVVGWRLQAAPAGPARGPHVRGEDADCVRPGDQFGPAAHIAAGQHLPQVPGDGVAADAQGRRYLIIG